MIRAEETREREKEREANKLMHSSRLEKIQENHSRLKESQIQNLAIREELAREKLEYKKK